MLVKEEWAWKMSTMIHDVLLPIWFLMMVAEIPQLRISKHLLSANNTGGHWRFQEGFHDNFTSPIGEKHTYIPDYHP